MKRIVVAVLIIALLAVGLLAGCEGRGSWWSGTGEKGSGDLETRVLDLSGFNRVEVGPAFYVEISQSDLYSVSITADDNLIDFVDVSRSGDTLRIGLTPGDRSFTTLRAEITMPDLYRVELYAATSCEVEGFSFSHDFTLDLSAASTLIGDMEVGNADFDLSAASSVRLRGLAGDIRVDAGAASEVELGDFPVDNADVKLSGASHGTVRLDGRLDAEVSGASTLEYIGQPTIGDIEVTGASTLRKR
jgi:hypothetical protein